MMVRLGEARLHVGPGETIQVPARARFMTIEGRPSPDGDVTIAWYGPEQEPV